MLTKPSVPDYVPEGRVFKFDIYADERVTNVDLHEGLKTLHRDAPDIFWTTENGGHWVATRFDTMQEVLMDHDRFSAKGNQSPNVPESMPMIPLNLDPPAHNYYRSILMRHFGPASIKKMEPRVEHWAKTLVDNVADKGSCEFMDDIASLFPVSIFMEMMGLPLERLHEYRAIVVEYFSAITPERYMVLQAEITKQMREVLDERKEHPRDDLASKLQTDELDGRRMTMPELESLTNLLFQAGMDTVANFAGFFFRYLGTRPELQKEMRENPDKLMQYVDEGFRMLGVVNNARRVRHDLVLDGVEMKEGNIVMCMLPLGGLDERKNPAPDDFDVNRRGRDHMLFSKGVHLCIGHTLARAEMKALMTEWFKRIPEFRIAPGYTPEFRAGQVMGIANLPLEWDMPAKG
jgi:cytochrome P450